MRLATAIALLVASTVARADTLRIGSITGGRTWTDLDPALLPNIQGGSRLEPGVTLYGIKGVVRSTESTSSVLSYSKATDSWTNVDLLPGCYGNAAVDAANSGAVYKLNSDSFSLCATTDFGKTVAEYLLDAACRWGGLTVDPQNPSTLYALACDKVVRSSDAGHTWSAMSATPGFQGLGRLYVDPMTPSILYGTTPSRLFKSTDSGRTWSLVFDRLDDDISYENFAIDPNASGRLYAAGHHGLETSSDGGTTWRVLTGLVDCVWVQPGMPAAVYVRQFSAGTIRKSLDGGATWTTFLEGGMTRFHLRFDPTGGAIFATSSYRIEAQWSPRQVFARDLIGRKTLAPGDIVSIYGRDLTTETRIAESFPLPNSLAGVEVRFAGKPAPLFFVSPGQVNAQVPFGLPNPSVMELRRPDGTVERQALSIEPSAPLMLTADATRKGPPLCFHSQNLRRVTPEDPAKVNETITCYTAGLGEVRPAIAPGVALTGAAPVAQSAPRFYLFWPPTSTPVFLTVEAPVVSARYALGIAGVYELTIQVPAVYPGKYAVWFDYFGWDNGSPNVELPILDIWNDLAPPLVPAAVK